MVPSMGEYDGLCGSSQTLVLRRWNVLTVASSSSSAATMSPLSAVCCGAHGHVVAVADRGVDHGVAHHLEQEDLALADQGPRQREDLLDRLLGQDRPAGGDPPEHRHVRGFRPRVTGAGLVVVAAVERDDGRPVPGAVGQAHLDGARQLGVAADLALLLQRAQLVRDAAGAVSPTASPISRIDGG